MNENWTAAYHMYYKANPDLITWLDRVIRQKQIRHVVPIIITILILPGVIFPLLQYSNTPLIQGLNIEPSPGKSKAWPSGPETFSY